ncbi:MAG TPA: T9SS type A sorting domain-containing protein [Candidatus Marinimicrobia bacterium]|jgi:hypothetical protein|nr:T9SS type A sorting domain-containing protein [Candidatus Neomarinimicrobiota bacterium]MDP7216820.1 T9SS type A sorting domain-containing protein [Candidatus Neomarinimicrobiota bacterium]MDP7437619.1 T9SS type A sorting domain-containing protein [Candidatus Neomarinimicrobiota bacterium]HBN44871.1 hypothetical protein [Candidatus Neomarinimicrobiota bacterium]HJM69459.1 T9SS type A sorting domain-containing protein [Candidatus Neomarinimicrobiota bacterium]|tara:strand:+ start:3320 stop:5347 length:2028 start_codon:yes stop_codon:yes gene_type:complete
MKRKINFKAILAGVVICGLATNIMAKDIRDVLDKQNIHGRTLMRVASQTWVYHTNGDLWMGWDSYGNTGDQTCSAIIPGWVYPGSNQASGHGYLNYNCRAGYWIIADIGGTLYEGTTGQYDVTEGTEPGTTTSGWAGDDYNKEPWVTTTTWSIPTASLNVVANRYSWSYNGESNTYFAVGEHDYNDFVIEEIHVINNGSATVDELVLASKADHDCTWNVPFPDWDYAFWTDDIVDYDSNYLLTMELDGDDPGSAANDFGIDDPAREYRGVRVGQTPLDINGTAYGDLAAADVNHMWWTGDEDPQTVASRYAMATMVSSSTGDKKDNNPSPMDMRYLQSYSITNLAAGDTATFVVAVLAGAGLANTQQAAANARKVYDWDMELPTPPAAPSIAANGVVTTDEGKVTVTWSYSDAQMAVLDPHKGEADFAGFRIYKAATAPRQNSATIMTAEGVSADNLDDGGEMIGDESLGTDFTSSATGPYTEVLDIPSASLGDYSNGDGTYTWTDEAVAIGLTYWYYVAAYDLAGSDAVHGSVPSLESYYTMCYPMQAAPDGLGGQISDVPPALTVSVDELTYNDIDGKASTDVFVAPNPWKANVMETYHGATTAQTYFVRFYNVKSGDDIQVFDVAGNLIFEGTATSAGSFDWNLVSRTRNQVSTGIYYWKVGEQTGKLAVVR